MRGKFKNFTPVKNNNYNVELPDMRNPQKMINVNHKQTTLYRFSDNEMGQSKACFLLGGDFAYIEIDCGENYEGCDEYIKLMSSSIDCILKYDSFISVKRLGLRKIDISDFDDTASMDASVEIPIWNNYKNSNACVPLKKAYSDLVFQKDVNTVFNIQRTIQKTENGKIQYIFDIDSYKNGSLLRKDDFSNSTRIQKMLSEQMNEPIFYYFIETFTEQYIQTFYHEQ